MGVALQDISLKKNVFYHVIHTLFLKDMEKCGAPVRLEQLWVWCMIHPCFLTWDAAWGEKADKAQDLILQEFYMALLYIMIS